MRKKVLCIVLALVMCMMVTVPTFADSSAETPPERAEISAAFGLKHISGSTYKMWAKINNPTSASVAVTLVLYDVSYNHITSLGTVSTNTLISLSKNVTLSSGTYHLRLTYTVNGTPTSVEKTYSI